VHATCRTAGVRGGGGGGKTTGAPGRNAPRAPDPQLVRTPSTGVGERIPVVPDAAQDRAASGGGGAGLGFRRLVRWSRPGATRLVGTGGPATRCALPSGSLDWSRTGHGRATEGAVSRA
jgi:hypothetical protein